MAFMAKSLPPRSNRKGVKRWFDSRCDKTSLVLEKNTNCLFTTDYEANTLTIRPRIGFLND